MKMKKVVVVGGNAAGLSAASQVKKAKPEWDVVVFERGSYISYGACGIPYYVRGLVPKLENLVTVTPEEAVQKRKLDLRMNCEVVAIEPREQRVIVETPDGSDSENYNYLVIATGAGPNKSGFEYEPSDRVRNANSLKDADILRRFIETEKPKKCAVIGAGYIAVEMLETLKERGLETHLIHRREDLSRTYEKEISDIARDEMEKEGIILNLNRSVSKISEQDGLVTVHTGEGKVNYDLVIVATGVVPNCTLAQKCGIETGIKGSIRVNEKMETNLPDIYAAGDCAETRSIITGQPIYAALALKANKEGVVAGVNIGGGQETFPGILFTSVTRFCNLGLARTGLTLAQAEESGLNAFKFAVSTRSRVHYYPGGGTVTSVLIADKSSGRLLGAQMAGPVESVKRIDVYATAITAGMDLDQIFQLDLAYAPPFSPVYDPVVLAGRVGRKMIPVS